ncbi:hypothetical protein Q4E40_00095 [Pontibacter sp. BT731]|jgi:hypothetical protein|uniref:hypothetical protein n=1 Tax=Pontibacter coccineus TaxID=3063328 RepID=UPI0026E23D21|nr:hypothetical protein [Pontibacter sp. BT731]MDO6388504.1 hypothetical protein [Pontibacter sp. BT731]
MKTYENKAAKPKQDVGNCSYLKSVKPVAQTDDSLEYSTIDGEVINSTLGTDAVKKGTGLFIGEYFVGILDSLSGMSNVPYLRY